jgi:hypothetical protein
MIKYAMTRGLIAAVLLFGGKAQAEDKESWALVEVGGVDELGFTDGTSRFGPAIGIDVTAVRNWLEIEAGVTSLFGNGHTEWSTDLTFKKPYILSNTTEMELGVGPVWMRATSGGKITDSIGGEAVLEIQFWPWPERKLGWFVEPSYGYDFARGHEQSLGVTLGLLIPIR